MNGPRLFARTHVAALAALLLLPACSPRKPIPSDPPEVRTEAQVRGAAKKSIPPVEQAPVAAAAPAPAPQPKAEAAPAAPAKADVLVAEVKAEPAAAAEAAAPVVAAAEATPVAAKPEAKQTEVKAAQSSPAPAVAKAEAPKVETPKAEAAKAEAPKADAAKPEATKAEAPKAEASAPATAAATATADATVKDAATKDAGSETAKDAERPAMVQIASFGTEKNAQAALAWLKEKGYSEARVVRVEQAQTVYHRVQAGPFQDPAAARKALEELKADWPQAFIPAD